MSQSPHTPPYQLSNTRRPLMKIIIGAFTLALVIVCIALPNLVQAGAEGDSASGSFKFVLNDDGETRFVEFKASELADGAASGDLTLSDPAAIPVLTPILPNARKLRAC